MHANHRPSRHPRARESIAIAGMSTTRGSRGIKLPGKGSLHVGGNGLDLPAGRQSSAFAGMTKQIAAESYYNY